jgi:hypothetical protein
VKLSCGVGIDMNKTLTVISFSLAVPSFVAIFNGNQTVAIISAVVAFLVCLLGFRIDGILRKNGSKIISAIFYFFTKVSNEYFVREQCLVYERKDAENWEFTKKYKLCSLSNTFNSFDDRFCWSSNSNIAKINAVNQDHTITNIRGEEIWTAYTVKFDTVFKGDEIQTGAVITDLNDASKTVRPFLSANILKKTRLLRMTVKIPNEFNPINPKFEIYSNSTRDTQSARISSTTLEYNKKTQEIEGPAIEYPRKGWRYVIVWEYKD